MDSRVQNQTKTKSQLHSAPVQAELFRQRPFSEPIKESESQPFSVQAQLERAARFGHDFGKVKVGGDAPAVVQQKAAQPKEEPEESESDFTPEPLKLSAPPVNPNSIQRQEEELAQAKPLGGLFAPRVMRSPEEEIAQTQPISPFFPAVVQRQEEEENEPTPPVQFKLVVGAPGDKYEQEADDVAAKVMAMPDSAISSIQRREEDSEPTIQKSPLADTITPLIQRQAEEEEIQPKRESGEFPAGAGIESRLASQKGKGSPLDEGARAFIEPRLGVDLSSVRVHAGSDAVQMNKELGAQAFAHGSDIYFNQGKYNPGTRDGIFLLTHEVIHTVQQTGSKKLQAKGINRLENKETLQAKISPISDSAIQCKQAPNSPATDPAFQAVVKKTKRAATQQKAHPPAKAKSAEAQAAAQPPANEVESKAQDKQVQEMNQQPPGTFNAAAFKAALMEKIAAITPKTLEEADEFKENNQIDSVKGEVSSQVTEEKKQASNPIEEKTKEPPDSIGIAPKPVKPLPPAQAGAKPGNPGAAGAAPKPKDASEVSLEAGSQELDEQMAQANVPEAVFLNSNEPQFQTALAAKKTAQADAVKAPQVYRKEEQATLAKARSQAQGTAQAQLQGMHGSRSQLLAQIAGLQVDTKGEDEQKRADVANHIQGIYNTTKQKVETNLAQLDTEVNAQFDQGAAAAKTLFENYVDERMERYKNERYSGELGWARWMSDKALGLPIVVNVFYEIGRKNYLASLNKTIDKIANLVAAKLNAAKAEIAKGRQEIQKYVAGLEPSLRQVGQEAAQNIQSQFDDLEQSVDNKQNELVDSLAQKYNENLQQVDAKIEEMKAANRGLVDAAAEAIGGALNTIRELKNMLMGALAKAGDAIEKIILDPIGFLGNLVAGLKQGFQNFAGNIWEHLKKGLIGWLTGALAGAGIQIQETFDLKGIFTLVMQVLGMAYDAIRPRLVNILGEKVVSGLESSFEMLQILVKDGVAGLWQFVQDKIGDLKAMVLDNIQNFVIESVIKAGVMWVLSLLNPASAFVKACKMIYDIVMFFIERGSQIAELVNAVMDSVSAIASGAVGGAAKLVENALSKALPVVISFMASLLGLGGISEKIQAIIKKVKQPIDKAIDWLIAQVVKAAKKLGNKLGFGKDKKNKEPKTQDEKADERTPQQKQADLDAALAKAEKALMKEDASPDSVKATLPALQAKYKLVSLELVTEDSGRMYVKGEVNPKGETPKREPPKVKLDSLQGWRPKWRTSTNKALKEKHPELFLKTKLKMKKGVDRRHIVSFEVIFKDLRAQIEGKTYKEAGAILATLPPGYKPNKERLKHILSASKKYLRDKFNDPENVWVGDSEDNQERGRIIARKLAELEKLQQELRNLKGKPKKEVEKKRKPIIKEITKVVNELRDARLDLPEKGLVKAAYQAMLEAQHERDFANATS